MATILSFTGNIGVNCKKIWGFYVWIASNILWVYVAYKTPNIPQIAMFIGYAVLNIMGIIQWRRNK
ncbi:MAG: nicotinamide mononucleotide transporter [Chitinophagales bacterium]